MALLFRQQLARPKALPVQIGVYLTLDQLGGPRATMAELTAELVKLKRSDVIRCIVAISSRLTDPKGQDENLQLTLANEMLSGDLLAELKKRQPNMEWHWTIFHRRQISFLLQVAVGACREETATCDGIALSQTLGRICLMVNTILHENEPQQSSDKWKQDYNFCFVPSIVPILDQMPRMEILARAYMLWFELPKLHRIRFQAFPPAEGSCFCACF